MNIREFLKTNTLLFDGAMGTYCSEILPESAGSACELLNITAPEKIAEIHKLYIDAGAKAIKTNTFSANRINFDESLCSDIIKKGFSAAELFKDSAFVFADIGPLSATEKTDLFGEYRFVADLFLNCGAEHFLFETNAELYPLKKTAEYIKTKNRNAFIIVSFACLPDGFTRKANSAQQLINEAANCEYIDAVGLNCASGARHMAGIIDNLDLPQKYFSAMPNAGYPTVLSNRTYYNGSASYFAAQIGSISGKGVKILGGCCGTTPEHIRLAAKAIKNPVFTPAEIKRQALPKIAVKNSFWDDLSAPQKRPVAVELDPPENSDISLFLKNAEFLKEQGASVITVADCPIGRPRMDSSLLACKLHCEHGINALPHLTCRDRNLNATKALLLGLCAEGVHNVLVVTGDPIPSSERDEVKSVYNFNSRMLSLYIKELSKTHFSTPFKVFGALNINAKNFNVQLRLAKEKEKNGVCGFLTQPVLSNQAFDNLKRAKAELKAKILGGIFPVVSYKNACFLNSEVAGISIDKQIIDMYENKSREQGEELALKISAEIAQKIHPFVDGYYIMTPFSRTELVAKIMNAVKTIKE